MIYLELSLIFFLATAVSLTVFMTVYLMIRRKRRIKYTKWNLMADLLIRKAIFIDKDTDHAVVPVTTRLSRLINNRRFRHHLTKKIISASRSLSGQSAKNLRALYLQLNLDKFALEMLNSGKWHIKAQAIQQLGVIGLTSHLASIYRYTNDKNELIRIEAQISVLKLYGFEGLRFLDVVSYQISEWQQILLLKELSLLPHTNLTGIEKWLASDNSSVVIFALKLARNYHHFELYDTIVTCLDHPDAKVRIQTIYTLTEIYTEGTSARLIAIFQNEPIDIQLVIMKALKKIAGEDDLPALLRFINAGNPELQLTVLRTIANIDNGMPEILNHPMAESYPMKEMIAHIKSEKA